MGKIILPSNNVLGTKNSQPPFHNNPRFEGRVYEEFMGRTQAFLSNNWALDQSFTAGSSASATLAVAPNNRQIGIGFARLLTNDSGAGLQSVAAIVGMLAAPTVMPIQFDKNCTYTFVFSLIVNNITTLSGTPAFFFVGLGDTGGASSPSTVKIGFEYKYFFDVPADQYMFFPVADDGSGELSIYDDRSHLYRPTTEGTLPTENKGFMFTIDYREEASGWFVRYYKHMDAGSTNEISEQTGRWIDLGELGPVDLDPLRMVPMAHMYSLDSTFGIGGISDYYIDYIDYTITRKGTARY